MNSFKLSHMYPIVSESLPYFSVKIVIIVPPNQGAGVDPFATELQPHSWCFANLAMAPSNRRKKGTAAANHSAPSDIPVEADAGKDAAQEEDQKCPGCTDNDSNDENKDTWISCDACKTWYHWGTCAGINAGANSADSITLDQVDKW